MLLAYIQIPEFTAKTMSIFVTTQTNASAEEKRLKYQEIAESAFMKTKER